MDDGFGNLLSQTVTKGSAPSLQVNVNGATNRITTGGYSYDANGNLTAMPLLSGMTYDVENRLTQVTHSSNGTDQYRYDPSNRRVWKKKPNGTEETYFYGVGGKKLGTYSGTTSFTTVHQNVYFAGKLIWAEGAVAVNDRLGSVSNGGRRYFPYGEERTTTQQDRTKFATYFRDETTALDYADQRYYGRTIGRFLTPDPYGGSASAANPQSWNRYTYVNDDPVNFNDPSGRFIEVPGPGETYCDIYPSSPQCAIFRPCPDGTIILAHGSCPSGGDTDEVAETERQRREQRAARREAQKVQNWMRRLATAVSDALAALMDPNCEGIFGLADNSLDPIVLLTSLQHGTTGYGYFAFDEIRSDPGTVTRASTTAFPMQPVDIGDNATRLESTGVVISINTLGPGFMAATRQDRAVTVLHELGHAFNAIYGAGWSMIKDDNKNVPDHVGVSESNSRLIREKCF